MCALPSGCLAPQEACRRQWRLGAQGLLLGLLLFFGAPAGESFIVNVLHLWHYGTADQSAIL